ncbi:unnamed protein product [Amoebophrya sp. A25]|nr:unnamed protein product [Amoebophrya sp. A25]|eukprot:GSA25T00012533001.1
MLFGLRDNIVQGLVLNPKFADAARKSKVGKFLLPNFLARAKTIENQRRDDFSVPPITLLTPDASPARTRELAGAQALRGRDATSVDLRVHGAKVRLGWAVQKAQKSSAKETLFFKEADLRGLERAAKWRNIAPSTAGGRPWDEYQTFMRLHAKGRLGRWVWNWRSGGPLKRFVSHGLQKLIAVPETTATVSEDRLLPVPLTNEIVKDILQLCTVPETRLKVAGAHSAHFFDEKNGIYKAWSDVIRACQVRVTTSSAESVAEMHCGGFCMHEKDVEKKTTQFLGGRWMKTFFVTWFRKQCMQVPGRLEATGGERQSTIVTRSDRSAGESGASTRAVTRGGRSMGAAREGRSTTTPATSSATTTSSNDIVPRSSNHNHAPPRGTLSTRDDANKMSLEDSKHQDQNAPSSSLFPPSAKKVPALYDPLAADLLYETEALYLDSNMVSLSSMLFFDARFESLFALLQRWLGVQFRCDRARSTDQEIIYHVEMDPAVFQHRSAKLPFNTEAASINRGISGTVRIKTADPREKRPPNAFRSGDQEITVMQIPWHIVSGSTAPAGSSEITDSEGRLRYGMIGLKWVATLLHEMGHALHKLGTPEEDIFIMDRDISEYPSTLLEFLAEDEKFLTELLACAPEDEIFKKRNKAAVTQKAFDLNERLMKSWTYWQRSFIYDKLYGKDGLAKILGLANANPKTTMASRTNSCRTEESLSSGTSGDNTKSADQLLALKSNREGEDEKLLPGATARTRSSQDTSLVELPSARIQKRKGLVEQQDSRSVRKDGMEVPVCSSDRDKHQAMCDYVNAVVAESMGYEGYGSSSAGVRFEEATTSSKRSCLHPLVFPRVRESFDSVSFYTGLAYIFPHIRARQTLEKFRKARNNPAILTEAFTRDYFVYGSPQHFVPTPEEIRKHFCFADEVGRL